MQQNRTLQPCYRKTVPRVCVRCGTPFLTCPNTITSGFGLYCSRACRVDRIRAETVRNYTTENETGCWIWNHNKNRNGYGTVVYNSKRWLAHRLSYHLLVSKVTNTMVVCHHCDTPPCINPAHLFVGTNLDNIRDAVNKGRMHRGEKTHGAKLNAESVAEILRRHAAGETRASLEKEFNMSQTGIWSIIHRRTWRHVSFTSSATEPSSTPRY
jgi:hypothetical protein